MHPGASGSASMVYQGLGVPTDLIGGFVEGGGYSGLRMQHITHYLSGLR